MIEFLPYYIPLLFMFTTLLTLAFLYRASGYSRWTLLLSLAWLLLQAIVSYTGFYTVTDIMPPRFLFLIAPPLLLIFLLFITTKGRHYLNQFDTRTLTFLHVVRVPVEIVLLGLSLHHYVPQLMTFEGRNFDVFSGVTAPFVAWFGYRSIQRSKTLLIIWNLLCLGLLINIVTHAVLSAPFPFQQLAFDQPNTGVLFFPFTWLPGFVVPVVLFSHLVCLRQLFRYKSKS